MGPWHFNKWVTLHWLMMMTKMKLILLDKFFFILKSIKLKFFISFLWKKCQSDVDWNSWHSAWFHIPSECKKNRIHVYFSRYRYISDDFSFFSNFTGFWTFAITFCIHTTHIFLFPTILNIDVDSRMRK